jgi:large subunit ribosomal protein L5
MSEYNYSSVMEIPKLEKIVINAGVGDATKDAKMVESMFAEIEAISCQKPIMTKSKKAIATFKLRENQNIGVKVTLRGTKM